MITFVLCTHNRPTFLARTLERIARLPEIDVPPEVIVVDNASDLSCDIPTRLDNGIRVREIRLRKNIGAAARNLGGSEAAHDWLVMLDDDSSPLDHGFIEAIQSAPDDVAAIGAEILLPDGTHEAGGLPEVFVGCGVAIRRDVFNQLGGYDEQFDYYAEEYDFCARLIIAGHRVIHDARFRVLHDKVTVGRDLNRIIHRLVRNNGWVIERYVPSLHRDLERTRMLERYRSIAEREHAEQGYEDGVAELTATSDRQHPTPLDEDLYARFVGRTAVVDHLGAMQLDEVALLSPGKNAHVITDVLAERGVRILPGRMEGAAGLVATLSPGPLTDARMSDDRLTIVPYEPFVDTHILRHA